MIVLFLMNDNGGPWTPYYGSIYAGVVINFDGPNTIYNYRNLFMGGAVSV